MRMKVRLGRFERPAPSLGVRCSIHLSYRRKETFFAIIRYEKESIR